MKLKLYTLPFLFLMTLMLGCGGEIKSFSFDSPDGDRKIEISGEQQGFVGPIMVTVTLHVPAGTKSFSFEHQSPSLTEENCQINWVNNFHAVLLFTLPDKAVWEVDCFLMDDKVEAVKRINLKDIGIFE